MYVSDKGKTLMDLLQLNQFQVLARVQHMTRAAEELYISQPSLSKTIKRLEEEVGVPLFDRTGRQIRLNRAGEIFLARVNEMFFALDEGRREVRDMARQDSGEVTLAAAALHWLPEPLKEFQTKYPEILFRLLQRSVPEMRRLLQAGKIDFAFLPSPGDAPEAHWQHLVTEEIFLIVPCSHALARRKSVPVAEAAAEAVVIARAGDAVRDIMEDACRQAGVALQVVCEADEPAATRDFVKAGIGAAFIPALIRRQQGEKNLVWVPLTDPVCRITLGLARQEEHYLSGAARTFQDFIAHYFAPGAERPSK